VVALRRVTESLRPERAIDAAEVLVERLADVSVDTSGDALAAPCLPLLREIGIGEESARHPDHVPLAALDDLLRELEGSDLSGGDDGRGETCGADRGAHRFGDVEVRAVGVARARHAAIARVPGVRVERLAGNVPRVFELSARG